MGLAAPASPFPCRPPDHVRRALVAAFCLSAVLHAAIVAVAERAPAPPEAGGESGDPIAVEIIEEAPLPAALPEAAPADSAPKDEPATAVAPARQQPPADPEPAAASLPQPRARPRPSASLASRAAETRLVPPPQSPAPEKGKATDDDGASGPASADAATPEAADASPASDAGSVPGQKNGDGRGSANPVGSSGPVSPQHLLDAYARDLWKRIAAHKPQGLQQVASTGVAFVVAPDGTLLAASITRSSGSSELDQLALQAVRSAAPLPPPPRALGGHPLSFEISFNFR